MKSDNMHNKNLGYNAEAVAKKHYQNKGWCLTVENKTERGSELDLVMEKESSGLTREILFVEVKSVAVNLNGCFGYGNIRPEDNFTKSKQKYFKRGIELYLTKNKLYKEDMKIRIDLACVYYHQHENKWTIKTYENIILD